MIKFSVHIILFFVLIANVSAQDVKSPEDRRTEIFSTLNDGPYVFIENGELIEKKNNQWENS